MDGWDLLGIVGVVVIMTCIMVTSRKPKSIVSPVPGELSAADWEELARDFESKLETKTALLESAERNIIELRDEISSRARCEASLRADIKHRDTTITGLNGQLQEQRALVAKQGKTIHAIVEDISEFAARKRESYGEQESPSNASIEALQVQR